MQTTMAHRRCRRICRQLLRRRRRRQMYKDESTPLSLKMTPTAHEDDDIVDFEDVDSVAINGRRQNDDSVQRKPKIIAPYLIAATTIHRKTLIGNGQVNWPPTLLHQLPPRPPRPRKIILLRVSNLRPLCHNSNPLTTWPHTDSTKPHHCLPCGVTLPATDHASFAFTLS